MHVNCQCRLHVLTWRICKRSSCKDIFETNCSPLSMYSHVWHHTLPTLILVATSKNTCTYAWLYRLCVCIYTLITWRWTECVKCVKYSPSNECWHKWLSSRVKCNSLICLHCMIVYESYAACTCTFQACLHLDISSICHNIHPFENTLHILHLTKVLRV